MDSLAPCIMVLGTTSDAGKSWVATAICRYLSDRGLKVAPFKAQNMSNNARVVHDAHGRVGEIGSAQYFQALAARCPPSLDMNPVLLKPESDRSSQVLLLGQVDAELSRTPWRQRSHRLWPQIEKSLQRLRKNVDVVVIEGAGSPAEINLSTNDVVNMRVARFAQASCLLVCDIDRGGAFAHLYGTWALLPARDQARIHGFVLNKFRGDPALLAPGPAMLETLTGVATVGVIPMVRSHALPQEDAQSMPAPRRGGQGRKRIVIVSYPRISNLDEFSNLAHLSSHELIWARDPQSIRSADLLILPGSKNTHADLAWLNAQGWASAIREYAQSGGAVLGICGGLQMLGAELSGQEIAHRDSKSRAHSEGLGLLQLHTHFEAGKTLATSARTLASLPAGPWEALSGRRLEGYEIHSGRTRALEPSADHCLLADLAWCNRAGNVLGIYLHGILEDPALIEALFHESPPGLEESFDGLAAALEESGLDSWLRATLAGKSFRDS